MCLTTLSGSNVLDGRSIVKKAKAALAECRILLSFWMDFLFDGNMPSGKDEEDALEHVLEKAYAEFAPDELDDAVEVKQVDKIKGAKIAPQELDDVDDVASVNDENNS